MYCVVLAGSQRHYLFFLLSAAATARLEQHHLLPWWYNIIHHLSAVTSSIIFRQWSWQCIALLLYNKLIIKALTAGQCLHCIAIFLGMLPRRTRNRPIMYLGGVGYHVFINNINSPGFVRPLLSSILSPTNEKNNMSVWADYLSCFAMPWKSVKKHGGIHFDMVCFLVEFWDEKREEPGSVLSVEVYCPSHWTAEYLLQVLEESFKQNNVISIINTYQINGTDFPFNTINAIHHKFKLQWFWQTGS